MSNFHNRFEFKVANGQGKPAIWFKFKDEEVVVNPLQLYAILWDGDRKREISQGIFVEIHCIVHEIYGTFVDYSHGYYNMSYDKKTFVDSAKQALRDLCQTVQNGGETLYKDFKDYSAKAMLVGLQSLNPPMNMKQIADKEIRVENFSFRFKEELSSDILYEIQIGNQTYQSYLSDYTNDFDRIRTQIETSLLSTFQLSYGIQTIELNYDMEPTSIRMDLTTKLARITIEPDGNDPILYGWCNIRQMVCSLYLGFLELCTRDCEDTNYSRLATYNKLQSCIIEDFIKGIERHGNTSNPRQRHITSEESMMRDFEQLKKELSPCLSVRGAD